MVDTPDLGSGAFWCAGSSPAIRTKTNKIMCRECEENTIAHTCPYAEDVNNDSESLCYCCDDCTYECAQDI